MLLKTNEEMEEAARQASQIKPISILVQALIEVRKQCGWNYWIICMWRERCGQHVTHRLLFCLKNIQASWRVSPHILCPSSKGSKTKNTCLYIPTSIKPVFIHNVAKICHRGSSMDPSVYHGLVCLCVTILGRRRRYCSDETKMMRCAFTVIFF